MHHQQQPLCTRTHQIGSLLLITATFFFTRLLNAPCNLSTDVARASHYNFQNSQQLSLNLKIYVYDEHEIDGLHQLLHGMNGKITPEACLKGQWGTQVISPLTTVPFNIDALKFHGYYHYHFLG